MADYVSRYLRVYLVDDHDIVRRGLRDLLAPALDIDVVGDSGSARHAVRALASLAVDVVVLDLRLQDGSGVEVCRSVRAAHPSVCGLLLTSADEDEALRATILAGAAGYVVKLLNSSDIATAIRAVGAGRSLIDKAATAQAKATLETDMDGLSPALTARERRLLTDVVEGWTDDQIAQRQGLSVEDTGAEVAALVDRLLAARPS